MKKIILLIIIITLFPITVYASEEYYDSSIINFFSCRDNRTNGFTSSDVIYNNGQYTLSGTIDSGIIADFFPPRTSEFNHAYNCDDKYNQECTKIILYLKDSNCTGVTIDKGKTGIYLVNGNNYDTVKKYYIGKDYKYENNHYKLVNYTEHNINEVSVVPYLCSQQVGKYVCDEIYKTECKKLYKVLPCRSNIGAQPLETVVNVEDYFLVSENYKKENNKYYLINPEKVYPSADAGKQGYTCHSHEDSCENLFKINVTNQYDSHDGGRKSIIENLVITTKEENKELKKHEKLDLTTFYTKRELSQVFSSNPEVADIKDEELILYKVGETKLIYEDDFTYKAINLKVTEDDLNKNPNTKTSLYIIVSFILLNIIIVYIVFNKKKNKKLLH